MSGFFYSVIEGFYGRQWSWQSRHAYADFLRQQGFGHYIYAPKGDPYLRSSWRQSHPDEQWQQLSLLASHYRQQGVGWGLGLSPAGLSGQYTSQDKRLLRKKITQINRLSPDVLCILFDDIRGDVDGLAYRQLEVIADITATSSAARHVVCPTYYSFDPVLEQVFGKMPEDYWRELGRQIPADVDIFWTGKQVISSSFSAADIASATELFGRKPVIWDNYPVNDGRKTSQFLHLKPYRGRPGQLQDWAAGHIVNPMNQARLSQLVLASLSDVYQLQGRYDERRAFENGLGLLDCESLATQLAADAELFQQQGLSGFSEQARHTKIALYKSFQHPAADEVAGWLSGDYQFDPDCLTE